MIWHSSEIDDVLNELNVDKDKGLANGVADMRLEQYGRNAITNIEDPTFAKRFFAQFNNKLVYALIAISIISFIVSLLYNQKNAFSSLLIIAIVVINALISAYHLYKGDTALNAMKSITNPNATVLRDGVVKQLPSDELVPGDILILQEGDYITADARIIEAEGFRCNELSLSGISVPIEKKANVTVEDITPASERINMVFSGCSVVHGNAKAVVVETGLNSEVGHSSAIIQQTGADTLPLQSALDNMSKIVNVMVLVSCILVFIIGIAQNFRSPEPFASITVGVLMNAIALAVASIPESLPAISTIVIALGIQRIVRDNIIIKNTQAIETLGKTTVICCDKTGILTRNHMNVDRVYDGAQMTILESDEVTDRSAAVLRLAATCSTLNHDPTENAIKAACIKYNSMSQTDVDNLFPRLCTIPFDSDRKTMTSINMINGTPVAIVKGAPEMLVDKCIDCNSEQILKVNDEMAAESLRVVAIAIKKLDEIPANPHPDEIETGLSFVGLIGLSDPPRNEAIEGIKVCKTAGIRTVMITGDNLITAKAVARRIGILTDGTEAITGAELAELSDDELAANIRKYSVFARVSVNDKLRIIKAWQSQGETVTITGDSIDDADALAAADIGCAIGKRGADVAKGNADIVISNNNFSSIVSAIRESRGLFANIKKSIAYLLGCNFGEIGAYLLGMIIFGAAPISAVPLLWINLLTDCAPAISLSMERAEENVMYKKSSALSGRLFNSHTLPTVIIHSVFIAIITLLAYLIGSFTSPEVASTMAFTSLALTQLFHSFNIKTTRSVFTTNFKSNGFMTYSSIAIICIICFLSLSPAGLLFGLEMLSFKQFIFSLLLSVAILPLCDILKLLEKRYG